MKKMLLLFSFSSLVLTGAIFGFFYAWICSTMWGLDSIDSRVAIEAMQGMNASVRNGVFAPAFFATPFILLATAIIGFRLGHKISSKCFILAGGVYFLGGLMLTMLISVPMNEALALIDISQIEENTKNIWQEYSSRWQVWNVARTVFSGLSLLFTGAGLYFLGKESK